MGNPLFNALGGMATGNNPLAMLQQLRSNPLGFLRQKGFSVPDNLNDPNQIIQHLMNSGQVSQSQYEQARQITQNFGMK